jgi:hypothetical protein
MIPMYERDLNSFRAVRAETLRLVQGLGQGQLDFTPVAGKWSAGEVLDHLLLAEKLYRDLIAQLIDLSKAGRAPLIEKGFEDVNTSILFIPPSLLPFLSVPFTVLNMFVPDFVRQAMTKFRIMPVQRPDIADPRKGRPGAELRDDLRVSIAATEALLAANRSLDYSRMRYRHPLTGDNNVLQVFRILANHEQRHQSQLKEILNSKAFPKAA